MGLRPSKKATTRRRVVHPDALRFRAGFEHLLIPQPEVIPRPEVIPVPEVMADPTVAWGVPLVIDVVRPADLVVLRVEAYGCDLQVGGANPVLRAKKGSTARLIVGLPFQHIAERAIYEGLAPVPDESSPTGKAKDDTAPTDGETVRPSPPVEARPARSSRLVFALEAGDTIPFSSAGILAAIGRLAMVVHPFALPGTALSPPAAGDGPFLTLPGGLGVFLGDHALFTTVGRGRARAAAPTVADLAGNARDLRFLRRTLAANAAHALRIPAAAADLHAEMRPVVVDGATLETPSLLGPGGLVLRPGPSIRPRPRPGTRFSRPANAGETAIEAPFRLDISPDAGAGWAHADEPVPAQDNPGRIELWHTRLGRRVVAEDGTFTGKVDERANSQRIVRAIWARDREAFPDWQTRKGLNHDDLPFRTSLDGADRHMLVRQTAETWQGRRQVINPDPVAARALWLSSLGAWLDLHGEWTTLPYSTVGLPSILSWDHVAPQGRDQYVRVVYPGYLYPFGHRAALVKVTERKMKDASPSVAGLYQRKFIVVGEPVRRFSQLDLPFTEVGLDPLVTPTLSPDPGQAQDNFFWPMVNNQKFRFVLHCIDQENRPVRLVAPLLWVSEAFQGFGTVDSAYSSDADSSIDGAGQGVAFAPPTRSGDTTANAGSLRFAGKAALGGSRPELVDASVLLPAVERLSPAGPVTISYPDTYKSDGFAGANAGQVWAQVTSAAKSLAFGGGGAGSDKAGGFLQPDLPLGGMSRLTGVVGDVTNVTAGNFDPASFLAGVTPKLFGLVPLDKLVQAVAGDLSKAPNVISEAVDRIEGFLADLVRAQQAVAEAVAEAQRQVQRVQGKAAELQQQAQQALTAAGTLQSTVDDAVNDILSQVSSMKNQAEAAVQAAMANPLQALGQAITQIETVAPSLPPLVRNQLLSLASVLRSVQAAADFVSDLYRFLNGFDPSSVQARFRYEWRPTIASWPSPASPFLGITDPILVVPPDGLVLAVDGRASGKGQMGVDVLAELRDFTLVLLPGTPLVQIKFDHLSFHAGSSGKTDVDVVINDLEFLGILGFVETLKELIPFDGFSDPPYLDVSPSGLTAGFTLALPNIAVGVFALSNISLGADLQVPFLGKAVTVGFNFCSRERPFTLAVTFIGGGGWFLLRLSPDGLDVLEVGLEAGATLSVDFGVASGSVSAMLGIYMRLEGDGGSLTGYFRLRGEVDVLGLISASIELYLELKYQFDTGKMIGTARLTVKVEVLIFSGSVTIECQRQFAGSKGDPTLAQLMPMAADGSSPAWSEYCLAFAGETNGH